MLDAGRRRAVTTRHGRSRNLPSSDLGRTAAFYGSLGFAVGFRDDGWMILERGALTIEFLPLERPIR